MARSPDWGIQWVSPIVNNVRSLRDRWYDHFVIWDIQWFHPLRGEVQWVSPIAGRDSMGFTHCGVWFNGFHPLRDVIQWVSPISVIQWVSPIANNVRSLRDRWYDHFVIDDLIQSGSMIRSR